MSMFFFPTAASLFFLAPHYLSLSLLTRPSPPCLPPPEASPHLGYFTECHQPPSPLCASFTWLHPTVPSAFHMLALADRLLPLSAHTTHCLEITFVSPWPLPASTASLTQLSSSLHPPTCRSLDLLHSRLPSLLSTDVPSALFTSAIFHVGLPIGLLLRPPPGSPLPSFPLCSISTAPSLWHSPFTPIHPIAMFCDLEVSTRVVTPLSHSLSPTSPTSSHITTILFLSLLRALPQSPLPQALTSSTARVASASHRSIAPPSAARLSGAA